MKALALQELGESGNSGYNWYKGEGPKIVRNQDVTLRKLEEYTALV